MKYKPRICYTEEQKALMWDRWQKGESLSGKAFIIYAIFYRRLLR